MATKWIVFIIIALQSLALSESDRNLDDDWVLICHKNRSYIAHDLNVNFSRLSDTEQLEVLEHLAVFVGGEAVSKIELKIDKFQYFKWLMGDPLSKQEIDSLVGLDRLSAKSDYIEFLCRSGRGAVTESN